MNSKRMKQGLMGLALGLGMYGTAQAVNPDTMVVSVTPGNITFSVSIASVNASGYQFGTVNMAATTMSTAAIVVTNNGNIAEYFAMKVSNSAPDNWAPVASAPGADQFTLMAYMNATQPADASFANALSGAIPGAGAALYNQASTKTNALSTKNLWLRLTMPNAITGTGGAQTMTVFVNGQAS